MWRLKLFRLLVPAFLLFGVSLAYGWPWSRDMKDQPSIKPQEAPRQPPANTVPRDGWERPISREEAGQRLKNPVKATEASLQNGKKLFEIYCALCHGPDAKGMGPVSTKFIPPPDLTLPVFKERTDGFLYGTIRNGGALMPPYGEVLSSRERWDIVNYLRSVQGR
ncbi:MAG: cytochrome c [candidate division NC10 bacterium]|nr:cytochrome c [candidate division NC10 bacterium]